MYSGVNDITIFLTIVGVLSNVFAMVALRRKNLGQNSACSYMTAYAMSTVFALTFLSGLDAVYCLLDQNHIRMVVGWMCMLWSFVAKIVVNSRIWFLLTLSVDRLLYVRFPYKASVYCTVFTARVIVLIVDIGLVVTSVHAMWFYQDAPQGCFIDYTDLFVDFWTWSSNIIYFYLPFFLLLGVTTCLSVSLVVTRHPQICSNRPHSRPQRIRFRAVDEFAVTSVVTSLCFILLSAPKQAIDAVNLNFPSLWLYAGLNDQIAVVGKIAETLYVADHTLFGLIYVLCSKAVRREEFVRGRSNGHVHYIAANDVGVFQPEEATVNTAF
nr:hypothetical protein BaRGS_023097 [Batillaria attramentaria]KAG5693715.1 hypothetical protein BaRGS_008357 [Batillaria attramentaria]